MLFYEPFWVKYNNILSSVTLCGIFCISFRIHYSCHPTIYISEVQPTRCKVSRFISTKCFTSFRRFLRPSSGAQNCTCCVRYCQPIMLLAAIVDEMEFHLIHDSSKQQDWLTIPDAVCTVMSSWWWAEEPPETCRAFCRNKLRNIASYWLYFGNTFAMRGHINVKNPTIYASLLCLQNPTAKYASNAIGGWCQLLHPVPEISRRVRLFNYKTEPPSCVKFYSSTSWF